MKINLKQQTVTFKRKTFDKTYLPGDIIHFTLGPVKDLNKRFILATKGLHSIVLYKVRTLHNGDLALMHAFTASPYLASNLNNFVILATLDKK